MVSIPCPACGLPRAPDLLERVACPLCGQLGNVKPAVASEREPEHDRAWVIPEPTRPTPTHPEVTSRFFTGSLLGFLAGIAVALGGVLAWPAVRDRVRESNAVQEIAEHGAESASDGGVAVAPSPREVVAAFRVPLPPIETPALTEVPVKEPAVGPVPEAAPPNPFRPEAARALVLDHAAHYAPRVPPGSTVAIRGWVKQLIVRDLEAGAVLDCSELEAEEVIVVGKIDGGSRLSVRAPGGRVIFRAKVSGGSKVDVRAPGGTVIFETPTEIGRDGSKIAGGSTVDAIARVVAIHGRIEGIGTKVAVSLTARGSLSFVEIDGPARLEYGQVDPDDAEPTLTKGRIGGSAVVLRVE